MLKLNFYSSELHKKVLCINYTQHNITLNYFATCTGPLLIPKREVFINNLKTNNMKKIVSMLALVAFIALGLNSCAPKDADIQKAVQTAISTNPDATGVSVSVEKQVVTLTGEVKDEATSAAIAAAAQEVKGVKSVVNSLTVTPPPPVISAADETLMTQLKDALKDNPTVTFTVKDGVITLTGEVKKMDLPKLMQKISALKPVKVENNLTIK